MKKIILCIPALLILAACSKVVTADEPGNEISFHVANYVQTRADSANPGEFTNEDFGAYAWYSPVERQTAGSPMFANERVVKVGSEWKTVENTYFWPKTNTVDFISYSPYNEGPPSVTETTIAWTKYTVGEKDLMYADKALRQGEDIKTFYYDGVPLLFHHALAKLCFKVKAGFLEYTHGEETDEQGNVLVEASTTKWEVTLKSAKLSGIYDTGDLSLTVAADGTWPLPEVGEAKAHVWANPAGTTKELELVTAKDGALKLTTEAQDIYDAKSFYVLPQALADKVQTLTLNFRITTFLPDGGVLDEVYCKALNLRDFSTAWQMNQSIIYTICIKPTAIANHDDPHPNDPDDVVITFNPAQSDWEILNTDAIIQL